ncbi:MAG: pyridoxal-phosphate dependent enzyme, partial [Pseudomonadota bacterium]
KAECLQRTGSFKFRGAYNRLAAMDDTQREAGVVAFSSGNHAQGVARAARLLEVRAAIVMPRDAPAMKLARTQADGAEIVLYDRATQSREEIAAALAEERGATLVPSFDDPFIVAGQGTAGLEAAAQLDALGLTADIAIVCCGGGGLSSGISLAMPGIELVLAEPAGWDDAGRSLRSGEIAMVDDPPPTRCDALQTFRIAPLTFVMLRNADARGVAVTETAVERAMRHAFAELKLVVEPGGAAALAAVLGGAVDLCGRTALVTLSGGNVDADQFGEILASE